MNEPQFIKRSFEENPNRLDDGGRGDEYFDTSYEPSPIPESPVLVEKFGIQSSYMMDSGIQMKTLAIDEFIKNQVHKEGLRDSTVSYQTILDRLLQRFPESVERIVAGKRGSKIIDFLFKDAALSNKMSTTTYIKVFTQQYNQKRVEFLTQQLKKGLFI